MTANFDRLPTNKTVNINTNKIDASKREQSYNERSSQNYYGEIVNSTIHKNLNKRDFINENKR